MVDTRLELFCFGLGYVASALASAVTADGWSCAGTSRSEAKCKRLNAKNITAFQFDRDLPLAMGAEALAGATHILISVPPDDVGTPVLDLHGWDLANHGCLKWIGYLSTTGVYGNRDGDWVDETTPVRPLSERGRRRVAAESGWLELGRSAGVPVCVFRLASIYGPGRNPFVQLRAGSARRIHREGQVFGRIHVDDIVATLRASIAKPNPGAIYNLADDEPAPPDEVISYAAQLLGVEPPALEVFNTAELSEMGRSFYMENKRVSNRRIKDELGVTLKHPDYRVGLRALL
jgi:nucleoside-diphosphate-sugar epimerase